jgi:hypothetical protein
VASVYVTSFRIGERKGKKRKEKNKDGFLRNLAQDGAPQDVQIWLFCQAIKLSTGISNSFRMEGQAAVSA